MRILIANDDGIYSPGILALAEIAPRFCAVRIVAPDVEQSSAGHAIPGWRPLTYKRTPIKNFEAYRVNGTPADCVVLGVHNWGKVDVVLSGINLGSNLGNSIRHSGTVAAAKQATLLELRGIALSMPATQEEPNFDMLHGAIDRVLEILFKDPQLKLINVNFPDVESKGLRWTRQSVRHYNGKVVPGEDPMGRKHFWFSVAPIEGTEAGTDRWAVEQGYVSMTPLRIDLTAEKDLAAVAR